MVEHFNRSLTDQLACLPVEVNEIEQSVTSLAGGDLVWLHNPMEYHIKLAPHCKEPYRVLDSQGQPRLTYCIGNLWTSDGQEQVVHYDRLKPYTVGLLPAGCSSSIPVSPLHAASLQDVGSLDGDCGAKELLVSDDPEAVHVTGISEPLQTVSCSGRTVRQPVHFKAFVTYY